MSTHTVSIKTAILEAKSIVLLMSLVVLAFCYFAMRYTIAFNVAISDCLNSRIFLVDTWDKQLYETQLVAFTMTIDTPYYETGGTWVKKVAALGPQSVVVSQDAVITDNHVYALSTDYVLEKIGQHPSELTPLWRLTDGEVFMVGETLTSLDSRFWGPIKDKDIVGRAYAIL